MSSRPDIDISLLPRDWDDIRGGPVAQRAEARLGHEMCEGHRLFVAEPLAVALRWNRKDCAFWLPGEDAFAWTHFTGFPASEPLWPRTFFYDTWMDLVADLPRGVALHADLRLRAATD